MKIGLISCVKTKLQKKTLAKDLYISDLFYKSLAYSLDNYDKVFILSAKYGLLGLNDIIEPYELTLNNQNILFRKQWAYKVFNQLKNNCDIINDIFYFHTGIKYREFLQKKINHKIPFEKLSFGNLLKKYKELGY